MQHAERSHAIYAPSSAKRWTVCTASAEAIAQLGEQEEGEEARQGTEAHEEIERCLGALNGETVDPATMLIKPVDPDHPAAYGISLTVAYVRQLPPGRMWVEQRVHLTKDIHGTPDVRHWHAETATLTIIDYKNGFVGIDATDPQFRIYAAGSIFTDSLPVKFIRYAVVQPNDFRPVPRVKQHVETADALYEFAKSAAAIPAAAKTFVAGEHCRYCPLFGLCQPTQDILAHLAVALTNRPEQVPLAQRAIFSTVKKPIEDWFKTAEKKWTADALKGSVPPGMKLVTSQKHRAWKDEAEARAFVLERKGVDALDPPTPAQAEKLGLDITGLAEQPPGSPALAFDSDKREPWAQKSAAEMFAGVTGK